MAKQVINIGTTANDGTGDPLRSAFDKANDNFTELYNELHVPPSKTKEAFTITNATQTSLTLGQAPSPNNTNYADLYINGVYQNAANFTIASSTLQLVGGVYFPNGASVEVVITY